MKNIFDQERKNTKGCMIKMFVYRKGINEKFQNQENSIWIKVSNKNPTKNKVQEHIKQ